MANSTGGPQELSIWKLQLLFASNHHHFGQGSTNSGCLLHPQIVHSLSRPILEAWPSNQLPLLELYQRNKTLTSPWLSEKNCLKRALVGNQTEWICVRIDFHDVVKDRKVSGRGRSEEDDGVIDGRD